MRRDPEPASKNNGGMTLVEVLVAMAVIFIVFLGLNGAGLIVLDQNIRNALRDEAVNVAEMEIRAVRDLPFASLPVTDNTTSVIVPPRQIRGLSKTYNVTRNVWYIDPDNRQVEIVVSWQHRENNQLRNNTFRQSTIVRRK